MTDPPSPIIVTDANVLINLLHVARLDLCARLPTLEFVVPHHVREEITDSTQRAALDSSGHRAASPGRWHRRRRAWRRGSIGRRRAI